MIARSPIVLFILVLLTACNPLRPAATPAPEAPAHYSITPQATLASPERWWLAFNDNQLNQLEQQLFAGNLDIQQALYRLEQLEAQARQTHANRLPSLNLTGSTGRTQSVGSAGETRSTNSTLSLSAAYELDLWDKLADRDRAAQLQILASEDNVKTLLLSMSAQLANQYFLAQEQHAHLNLLKTQKYRSEILLELVIKRYQAGLLTTSSLYQAQRNLATIDAQIPTYSTALKQAENTIAVLLGQAPGTINLQVTELPQISPPVALGLPAELLTRRPDVTSALNQLAATDHTLAATIAERLPTLNLTATLGRTASSLTSGDVNGSVWSLVLGLTQPLFDGGRRQAAVDQQQAVRAEQLAATRQVLLTAMEEIESSLISERNYALRAEMLERQKAANSGYRNASLNNYRFGLSDSTNWLNSEIDQLGILSQQISNQRLWLSQRITLVKALGGSWMNAELTTQRKALREQQ